MNQRTFLLTVLLLGVWLLIGCGGQTAVSPANPLPTQAAVAVIETAVPPQAAPTDSSEQPAQPIAETVTPGADAPSPAERPLLPRFSGSAANTNQAAGLNAPPAALTIAEDAPGAFAAAVFTLNAALPAEPATAVVLRAPTPPLTVEQAQQLALRFGFNGPIYTEIYPDIIQSSANLPADAAPPPELRQTFYAFDGPRTLNVSEGVAYYTDGGVSFDYTTPLEFAQAAPLAEAFLQTRGLLDFPYALQPGWGQEVFVLRLIDGRALAQPDISVGVNSDGEIAFVNYQVVGEQTVLGEYPLVSAEAAWQQLQAGITADIVAEIAPQTAVAPAELATGFQYWPRTHPSGPDVHLYAWPVAFAPVDGNGPPRIQVLGYALQADEATLAALAAQVGQTVHVWGSLDSAANVLSVAGWEPQPALNPLFKTGTIQRVDGQARLQDAQSGETFILPDAPIDVAEGVPVNVVAWAVRDAGLAFPVLDWEGIDQQMMDTAVLPQVEQMGETAVAYSQIVIDDVALGYYATADAEAALGTVWQPAWRFQGTAVSGADNGDRVVFYVQAVDPAFWRP